MDIQVGDWTKLGSVVRDARQGRGLSQHDLARKAQVSRSWLARLEAGHRGAALEPLFRLLDALEMSLLLSNSAPDAHLGRASDDEARLATRASLAAVVDKHQATAAKRRQSWQEAVAHLNRSAGQEGGDRG